jgi:3-(methylthio)propanoyl-CoA dehydrogenase
MANFYRDNDDLRYYFERGIDWEPIVRANEADFRAEGAPADVREALDFYRDTVEMVGEFVATEIAPHAAEIDREAVPLVDGEAVFPPRLAGIFDKIRELELHGLCIPRDLGGMNAPLMLYWFNAEMLGRADVSVMTHHSFHAGIALALLKYSFDEGSTEADPVTRKIHKTRFEREIREIVRGEAWGCMDITEPGAGSDMAATKAHAEQDENGNWYVTGQKIFITSGHAKYHLVIARTEKSQGAGDAFAGLQGLSMFLVQAYEDDAEGKRRRTVTIDRLEEKLGHHGSATASLNFDRAPAQLIGKRGKGFRHMLVLMNNARIGVAFESIGICEAAIRCASAYAAERRSMGKTIDKHEMIADYLDEMSTDVQGLRAMAFASAFAEEMAQKLDLLGKHGESRGWHHKARRLTPLLKYLAAEKSVEMARRAVQIHGGNGYTRDYPAEKLLRDAIVMPIYEGTSQIQSLMAMRDTLTGILNKPQRFVRRAAQARWRALSARDPLERRVTQLQVLQSSLLQHLMARTAGDKFRGLVDQPLGEWPTRFLKNWDPKRDFAYAMLHAERLTRILADVAICELLLEQAQKHEERREVLERYLERAEPRCRFLYDEITTTGSRLLKQLGRERGGEREVG